MTNSIARTLPEAGLIAHAHGTNVVHAYRTHLGYSLDDLA